MAANTRYTIRVDALHPGALKPDERVASIRFTTGNDELADQSLAPPQLAAASILRGAPDCGGLPSISACIGGLEEESPTDLELIARRGDEILLRITSLVHDDGGYKVEEQPDCIELRRRAADGRRSAPTTICGDALLARDYRESDKGPNGWVQCRDGILGDRAAYEESSDSGAAAQAESDAAVTSEPMSDPKRPRPSSGCSIFSRSGNDLSALLPSALVCALLLCASRRRSRERGSWSDS